MPGYWRACDDTLCDNHQAQFSFRETVGAGIVTFL
jgi:hypothetical protein